MRSYGGKILIRIPTEMHAELSKESFETGRPINEICLEALLARRALKSYNPWGAVDKVWDANKHVLEADSERDIGRALAKVRAKKA